MTQLLCGVYLAFIAKVVTSDVLKGCLMKHHNELINFTGHLKTNECGYMNNDGKWRDVECSLPERYVCEQMGS